MAKNIYFKISTIINALCFLIILALISSVPVFATETHTINSATEISDENTIIVPKFTFSINSNKLFTFDQAGKISPAPINTALPVITLCGTTYVPIRAFCDAMGYTLEYNKQTKTINIASTDQSLALSEISVISDLTQKNMYFLLNGASYTQVQNITFPGSLNVTKQDNVLLLYNNASPSAIDNTLSPTAIESNAPISASTLALAKVTTTSDVIGISEVFKIQEDEPILTDEFVKAMQATAIAPKENYIDTLKKAYDMKYYKPFVNPYVAYSYPQMQIDIEKLKTKFPEYIKSYSAGKSIEGRDLTTIEFGHGNKHIYVFGSHHAREYISTSYIMKFVNDTAYAAKTGINTTNYDVQNILNKVTFHIIPMVNPDGVNLVQNGVESVSSPYREGARTMSQRDAYGYRSWKSNIRGVDLNRNYPARWQSVKTGNSSAFYPGPYAASEPEVQAVMNYMKQYPMDIVVSVHSQGQLLYWSNPEENMGEVGRKIIKSSGFRPILDGHNAPAGYLSNYVSDVYHKYEMTVELCKYIGPYPYPDDQFDKVWAPAKDILLIVGDEIAKQ